MNVAFSNGGRNFSFEQLDSLVQQGIRHGFIGRDLDFSGEAQDSRIKLLSELDRKVLVLLRQVHGTKIVEFIEHAQLINQTQAAADRPEGDALIFRRGLSADHIYGVRTADCVPLVVVSTNFVGLIHAGWRGLAQGIISQTLNRINELESGIKSDQSSLTVLIGPCAGPLRYQVGSEVIDALAPHAVHSELVDQKAYLNLSATAVRLIDSAQISRPKAIFQIDRCTISSPEYYSFRRKDQGSNLTFVVS